MNQPDKSRDPMLIESFRPAVAKDAAVLILGTMPGERSLAEGQYYAHPRNRFWQVMQDLAGIDPDLSYSEQLDGLGRAGIALWDVLRHCMREGSLDGSIVASSEIPNDIGGLLEDHASIRAVALNGRKAATAFRRRILPTLPAPLVRRVGVFELPSTSPANARKSRAALADEWSALAPYLSEPTSPR
jgi:TDG/mug DNA glycosylase family protein